MLPAVPQVEHETLNLRIYQELKDLIQQGVLPMGSRLNEKSLSEQMGVSRTPLREAIVKLCEDGLVELRPRRGAIVATYRERDVNEIYDVRKAVEGLAARLVIEHASDEEIQELQEIVDYGRRLLQADDGDGHVHQDQRFHQGLIRLSRNSRLVPIEAQLRAQVQAIRAMVAQKPGRMYQAADEHDAIIAALRGRDASAAVLLLEEHIESVKRDVIAMMRSRNS